MAQAHVIISEGDYLRSLATHGNSAQDILYQFEPGGEFEKLGELRLRAGYGKRSPDLAVMSRKLDFNIPEEVLWSDRRITIFTITALANTSQARALTTPALAVIGSGEAGAGGNSMIDYLSNEMGDRLL